MFHIKRRRTIPQQYRKENLLIQFLRVWCDQLTGSPSQLFTGIVSSASDFLSSRLLFLSILSNDISDISCFLSRGFYIHLNKLLSGKLKFVSLMSNCKMRQPQFYIEEVSTLVFLSIWRSMSSELAVSPGVDNSGTNTDDLFFSSVSLTLLNCLSSSKNITFSFYYSCFMFHDFAFTFWSWLETEATGDGFEFVSNGKVDEQVNGTERQMKTL